jgi:hypothetical protein
MFDFALVSPPRGGDPKADKVESARLPAPAAPAAKTSKSQAKPYAIGQRVFRKGEACTVVKVDQLVDPPSYVVRKADGSEVGTEHHLLQADDPAKVQRKPAKSSADEHRREETAKANARVPNTSSNSTAPIPPIEEPSKGPPASTKVQSKQVEETDASRKAQSQQIVDALDSAIAQSKEVTGSTNAQGETADEMGASMKPPNKDIHKTSVSTNSQCKDNDESAKQIQTGTGSSTLPADDGASQQKRAEPALEDPLGFEETLRKEDAADKDATRTTEDRKHGKAEVPEQPRSKGEDDTKASDEALQTAGGGTADRIATEDRGAAPGRVSLSPSRSASPAAALASPSDLRAFLNSPSPPPPPSPPLEKAPALSVFRASPSIPKVRKDRAMADGRKSHKDKKHRKQKKD